MAAVAGRAGTVLFLGAFYTLASWPNGVVGPSNIIDAVRSPVWPACRSRYLRPLRPPSCPGSVRPCLSPVFSLPWSRSTCGCQVCIWSVTGGNCRLPGVSPGIDRRVPIGGSIVQSVIAAAVILVAIILNADPLPPSSPAAEAAAIGVLFMIGASLSVILFYRRTPARPERWQWLIAPAVGGVALTVILAITVLNITQVTGSTTSYVQWLLPGVILVAAITGAVWAQVLRQRRPGVYAAIGYGLPKPLAVLDRSLSHLEL